MSNLKEDTRGPQAGQERLVDVVRTREEAQTLPQPPLLILDSVTEFLDQHSIGRGEITWERIGEGQSNVTYRLIRDGADVVLRRGPRPPIPRSTHDMLREARVQSVLGGHGIAVPQILAVCEDETILGVPFYVMDFVQGEVVTDSVPPLLHSHAARRDFSQALVDQLVRLHQVDVSAPDVAALGRPEGYLQRQVSRFAALWDGTTRRSLPQVAQLAQWLEANRPQTQRHSVVHGDYRAGNAMFRPQAPVQLVALLDWEMSTLGDPLADLGYFAATYADPRYPLTPLDLTPVTAQEGFMSRDEVIRAYAEQSGLDLSALPWYQTLALWKAAIFSEAIYTRWLDGEEPAAGGFAASLEEGVPRLLSTATEISKTLE